MAEKKTTKKAAPAKKKAPVKKSTAAKVTGGDSFVCGVCGLAVTVDEECGCVEVCDIICCGRPMKEKKARAKAKPKAKPKAKTAKK